jgi:predicted hydrolase (HD superfamily)
LKKAGMTPEAIQVIQSHAYGTECGGYQDKVRTRFIEYALAAGETITGLVYACALVRPSKKLADVEVSSVVKAIKKKDFARNCNRDVIRECENLGLTIEEFCELALKAIQEIAGEVGI